MTIFLKQSTSVDIGIGPFVDSTDGVTAETALTITQPDIRLKKNGGAWAQKNAAQTLSHEENGWYEVTLDATDTGTLGVLQLAVHESGALPVFMSFHVVTANIYDTLFSTDVLDVSVVQYGGTNGTFASGRAEVNVSHIAGAAVSTTTAQIGVNVVQISGDATSADNLESYTDGTTPMPVNVTQISGDATAADNLESYTDGTTPQPVNVTQFGGTNLTATGGRPEVNTTHWRGTQPNTLTSGRVEALVGAMGADVLTAAATASDFGTEIGTAVWATGTRVLTANTNLNDLSAAGVRSAVGLASANLDTQLDALPTAAEIADANWDEATSGHTTAGTFGQLNYIQRANTAQAGAAGTITLDASASATNDIYNNSVIILTGGTGAGQARTISDYVGSTKVASVTPDWSTNPSSDSVFVIVPMFPSSGAGASAADVWAYSTRTLTAIDEDTTTLDLDATIRGAVGMSSANLDTQLNALPTTAEVNAEMLDVLTTDTFSQPGQGNPPATASFLQMLQYLYKAWRNRHTQTASEYALYADDGTTKDQEAAVSDNGTTFERSEVQTGA